MEDIFNRKCKIISNEKLGRYVQAKQELTAGECLLMEQPSLLMASYGEIRCQNCFKLTNNYCKICLITPLCGQCKQHYDYDCRKLATMAGVDSDCLQKHPDTYGIVKLLLLQESVHVEHFNNILQAESHIEQRRNTTIWQYYNRHVVQPILKSNVLQYLLNGPKINEQFLQHLCAVIDVNGFEIRAPDTGSMRGVYIKGALLSHDCVANTCIAIDDKYRMKIYANKAIKCGEIVTNCYTNILLNTAERKKILLEGKYFHCTCRRCEDPTELGSHMSTLICTRGCRKGYMIQDKNNNGNWQCLECEYRESSEFVDNMLKVLQSDELQEAKHLQDLEMQLIKLGKLLHPQHFMIIDIKQYIATALRSLINDISCCPGPKVYERTIDLCKDILKVLEIIAPGISRLKAIVIYQWGSTWAEYNRMRYQSKELNKKDLLELLQESELMLREAIRMLLFEPKETPEGKLLVSMMQELKYLQTDLKMLK